MSETRATERDGSAHSVLIVDDHPDTLEVLADLFRALGHDVRIASRGHEAICVARDFAPELVLLDIGLPDIGGYEVIQALRSSPRTQASYIVAITGWSPRAADLLHAGKAGFDRYILKPIDLAQIREILRSSTQTKSP